MQQVFHTTLLLTILAILVSCNSNKFTNQEHPEYFDRVFQQADSLKNLKKFKEVEFLIDSAFQNFPEAGIIDRWRKYHIMAQINNKYLMNWEKSLHYTDSMLFLLKDKEENYPREYFSTLFEKETAFIGMKDFNSAFEVFHLTKEFKNK